MKRKFMIYGLIGGVCLLAGVAAAGSGTLNKSDNKRNKTVSNIISKRDSPANLQNDEVIFDLYRTSQYCLEFPVNLQRSSCNLEKNKI